MKTQIKQLIPPAITVSIPHRGFYPIYIRFALTTLILAAVSSVVYKLSPPVLGGLALINILILVWDWFYLRWSSYKIDQCFIRSHKGVFNSTYSSTDLYKVYDVTMKRSFIQKLLKLSTVEVMARDATTPYIIMKNIDSKVGEMCFEMINIRALDDFVEFYSRSNKQQLT